jgi:hypothetical protein
MAYKVKRLTLRDAEELVTLMGLFGDHPWATQLSAPDDVGKHLEQSGIVVADLVEQCRDFEARVPWYENLVEATWTVSPGATVHTHNPLTGQREPIATGPGKFNLRDYWASFELAIARY